MPKARVLDAARLVEYVPIFMLGDTKDDLGDDGGRPSQVSDAFLFHFSFLTERINVSSKDARLIAVRGDSMAPLLQDGDLVLIDTSDNEPSSEGIYAVRLAGRVFIKRLQQLPGGKLTISSDHPSYEPIVLDRDNIPSDLCIIGRVAWASRTF